MTFSTAAYGHSTGRFSLRLVHRLAAWIVLCHERAQQRQALAELDDRMLRDVGLTRAQARFEAEKPCWRV